jgi:putative peptide zinc metalloprotease protein
VLAVLPIAGSLYVVAGLMRRAAAAATRWSAGRPGRRVLAAVAAAVGVTALAASWVLQDQFRGW